MTQRDPADIDEILSDLPPTLTPRALANLTGVSERTLANRRWRGEPPRYLTVASRVVYPRRAVAEWLRGDTAASDAPAAEAQP